MPHHHHFTFIASIVFLFHTYLVCCLQRGLDDVDAFLSSLLLLLVVCLGWKVPDQESAVDILRVVVRGRLREGVPRIYIEPEKRARAPNV